MSAASLSVLEQRFAHLRSNKIFELSVIAIIVFSALIIGVKTYPLPTWTQPVIVALDWAITLFFMV
jgi:voltage-gated sodium channel